MTADDDLETRIRERIAALEADRDETVRGFNAIIAELKFCLGETPDGESGGEGDDEPGKDDGPADGGSAAPRPSGNGKPKRKKPAERNGTGRGSKWPERLREALLNGPLRVKEIENAVGKIAQSFRRHLQTHPWFERTGPGRLDPYQLTEAGRNGT